MFGSDAHAANLKNIVKSHNVDISLARDVDKPSGQAFILLQGDGENSIIIVGAANVDWPSEFDDDMKKTILDAGIILLQREIPDPINQKVAKFAGYVFWLSIFVDYKWLLCCSMCMCVYVSLSLSLLFGSYHLYLERVPLPPLTFPSPRWSYSENNVKVVMDVGGRDEPMDSAIYPHLYVLSPNETELNRITGLPTDSDDQVCFLLFSLFSFCLSVSLTHSCFLSPTRVLPLSPLSTPSIVTTSLPT